MSYFFAGEIQEKNRDLEREKQTYVDNIKDIEGKIRDQLREADAHDERGLQKLM